MDSQRTQRFERRQAAAFVRRTKQTIHALEQQLAQKDQLIQMLRHVKERDAQQLQTVQRQVSTMKQFGALMQSRVDRLTSTIKERDDQISSLQYQVDELRLKNLSFQTRNEVETRNEVGQPFCDDSTKTPCRSTNYIHIPRATRTLFCTQCGESITIHQ